MDKDSTIKPEIGPPRDEAANRLGVEPVGKLLLSFSIPAITGMVVNALYNVVDRVYVGRGVNEVALGGLALVLPLMTISMAFAMLFGIGTANLISMRLGQGRKQDAENALNHCVRLLIVTGIILTALGLLFTDPLLSIMGAQDGSESLVYARDYFRIILFGQVFSLVSFGLSHCARAQGFPTVTMVSMFVGAGMNIVLDPIFIFVFHWGVAGAAWATILSQLASMIWILAFLFGNKAILRLRLKPFVISGTAIRHIMSFGLAQFLLQLSASAVQVLFNLSMNWYGTDTLGVANGGDVALSGMNIANSIILMILMPIFGINQGSQPVLGYNYGAKKYSRVLSAYTRAVLSAVAISTVGFLIVYLFTVPLVHLFAPDGSSALLSFAPKAMRVMGMLLPFIGFQIVSSNMFVVTGRPKTSIVLSLLRQVIVLIPCLLIFGRLWGLNGVLAATPVADGVAALVTGAMIWLEIKKLRAGAKLETVADQGAAV